MVEPTVLGEHGEVTITAHRATPFGSPLRRWRSLRGLTQLELSTEAQTPARHVSFLETGRSRPTRPMVSWLAEALDLSLRERNALLVSAGFGPDDPELAALLDVALEAVRDVPRPVLSGGERVLCPHFDIGGRIVRTMTVVAQFGAAQDITLDELRIELIYPADEEAADFFAGLASVDGEMPSGP